MDKEEMMRKAYGIQEPIAPFEDFLMKEIQKNARRDIRRHPEMFIQFGYAPKDVYRVVDMAEADGDVEFLTSRKDNSIRPGGL